MKTDTLQELHAAVMEMLPIPVPKDRISLSPLREGGNNRLYRVSTPEGVYVLKCYFRHPMDTRDRLNAEFSFAAFAWRHGIRCIPEPLGRNDACGCALFRFVDGVHLLEGGIGPQEIDQALGFFHDLNAQRSHADAQDLPNASEACFSLRQHVALIDERIDRLRAIPIDDELTRGCLDFVQAPLAAAWLQIRKMIENSSEYADDVPLDMAGRVISPSDFGFHNAIKTESGLIFLDFEYAGWDDPAKVVGDFFSQVAVPVPPCYVRHVADTIARTLSEPEHMSRRIRLLLPLYRVKWCLILLNEFLPVDGARRAFAREGALKGKKAQLDKSRQHLANLEQLQSASEGK